MLNFLNHQYHIARSFPKFFSEYLLEDYDLYMLCEIEYALPSMKNSIMMKFVESRADVSSPTTFCKRI